MYIIQKILQFHESKHRKSRTPCPAFNIVFSGVLAERIRFIFRHKLAGKLGFEEPGPGYYYLSVGLVLTLTETKD